MWASSSTRATCGWRAMTASVSISSKRGAPVVDEACGARPQGRRISALREGPVVRLGETHDDVGPPVVPPASPRRASRTVLPSAGGRARGRCGSGRSARSPRRRSATPAGWRRAGWRPRSSRRPRLDRLPQPYPAPRMTLLPSATSGARRAAVGTSDGAAVMAVLGAALFALRADLTGAIVALVLVVPVVVGVVCRRQLGGSRHGGRAKRLPPLRRRVHPALLHAARRRRAEQLAGARVVYVVVGRPSSPASWTACRVGRGAQS